MSLSKGNVVPRISVREHQTGSIKVCVDAGRVILPPEGRWVVGENVFVLQLCTEISGNHEELPGGDWNPYRGNWLPVIIRGQGDRVSAPSIHMTKLQYLPFHWFRTGNRLFLLVAYLPIFLYGNRLTSSIYIIFFFTNDTPAQERSIDLRYKQNIT